MRREGAGPQARQEVASVIVSEPAAQEDGGVACGLEDDVGVGDGNDGLVGLVRGGDWAGRIG